MTPNEMRERGEALAQCLGGMQAGAIWLSAAEVCERLEKFETAAAGVGAALARMEASLDALERGE